MTKRIFKCIATLALPVIFGICNPGYVGAAEKNATPESAVVPRLEQLPDNQVIMALPEGGFIANRDGSSNFTEFQLRQNAGTLVTAGEMKYSAQNSNSQTFSGDVLFNNQSSPFRNKTPYYQWEKVLGANQYYESQSFGGAGWQFSGFKFKPANGTGAYLAWRAIGDSGMVGSPAQAASTYTGRSQGVAIYPGKRQYIDCEGDWCLFYSFNPAGGSKYIVENW